MCTVCKVPGAYHDFSFVHLEVNDNDVHRTWPYIILSRKCLQKLMALMRTFVRRMCEIKATPSSWEENFSESPSRISSDFHPQSGVLNFIRGPCLTLDRVLAVLAELLLWFLFVFARKCRNSSAKGATTTYPTSQSSTNHNIFSTGYQ
jgi:hypothetical protein